MRLLPVVLLALSACAVDPLDRASEVILADPARSGVVAQPIHVVVRTLNGAGELVGGVPLAGVVSAGSLAADELVSDRQGEAAFVWTMGTIAGGQILEVTILGPGSVHRLQVTALPGPATAGVFSQHRVVVAADSVLRLPVAATDQYGNTVLDPPIRSVDYGIALDSARWRPTVMGRTRFVLDLPVPDTIEVMVHPPQGAYFALFSVGDTVWTETGTLVPDTVNAGDVCPVPAGALSARVLAAIGVRRIRAVGGFADTLGAARRAGAIVHVLDTAATDQANQSLRYRPLGRDAAPTCAGFLFVRPWRFSFQFQLADSLVITPR